MPQSQQKLQIRILSTDRVTVCGLPGTGKTTLSRYFCTLLEPQLLIYDPLDQYSGFSDKCRYVPKSDSLLEFDSVCRKLRQEGNITFVVEEAERYIGQGKPLGDNAFDLINRGRNWGVGIIAVTRRIQRLSKDFFDLCSHAFFFKCGLKSREYIADMIGKEDTKIIMRLPQWHFLHYNVTTEESSVHVLKLGVRQRIEDTTPPKIEEKEEEAPAIEKVKRL